MARHLRQTGALHDDLDQRLRVVDLRYDPERHQLATWKRKLLQLYQILLRRHNELEIAGAAGNALPIQPRVQMVIGELEDLFELCLPQAQRGEEGPRIRNRGDSGDV